MMLMFVTQNENGPCPMIALANVLLLSGKIKIQLGETLVSSSHLMDMLGSCLFEHSPVSSCSANYQQNIQDAMAVFPKLQTGLDVNIKFIRYCNIKMSDIVYFSHVLQIVWNLLSLQASQRYLIYFVFLSIMVG